MKIVGATVLEVCGRYVGVKVDVANFLLGQSIGIDENNTFELKFLFLHQNCRIVI